MMVANNIDEVIALLEPVIAGYRERRSPLAFFPAMYRAVTRRVRAGILAGEFENGPRMDRLDTAFANRYFAALDDVQAKRQPPRAWQAVFDVETRPRTLIVQHLLLGMNAHINFDLPVATQVVADGALDVLEKDFLEINRILGALLDRVQGTVDRFSPLLKILDDVGGRSDEFLVTFSLVTAREEAWHEATRLSGENTPLRDRSILSLDRRVALLARNIIVPGGAVGAALDLIARTEKADVGAVTEAILAIQ